VPKTELASLLDHLAGAGPEIL